MLSHHSCPSPPRTEASACRARPYEFLTVRHENRTKTSWEPHVAPFTNTMRSSVISTLAAAVMPCHPRSGPLSSGLLRTDSPVSLFTLLLGHGFPRTPGGTDFSLSYLGKHPCLGSEPCKYVRFCMTVGSGYERYHAHVSLFGVLFILHLRAIEGTFWWDVISITMHNVRVRSGGDDLVRTSGSPRCRFGSLVSMYEPDLGDTHYHDLFSQGYVLWNFKTTRDRKTPVTTCSP